MPPGQPQHGGAGRLHRIAGHDAVDDVRGELLRREHAALVVAPRVQAEQRVEHVAVDHRHGEQVGGVGQRVDAEAQAPHPDLAPVQRGGHVPGERPGVVVHGALGAPAEFLVELAEHAPPQREVLALVPGGLTGRLEHADRDDLVHPARVPHLGRVPPVQREPRPPTGRVEPERQRGDGQVGRAAAQVARVRDPGARAGRAVLVPAGLVPALLVPPGEPGGGVLVRGRLAGVHAVEVAAAGERQPGLGEVGLGQPVGGAVLEHCRGGQVRQCLRVAAVARPVRPLGQQRADRGGHRIGRSREVELDVVQRDGPGGLPLRDGEQRGAGHPALVRVVPGRVDRQGVAMLLQVGAHP
ncbi:MAG: hypothetical protein ACRDOD_04750 [Streptosporangiaceae bacterium]